MLRFLGIFIATLLLAACGGNSDNGVQTSTPWLHGSMFSSDPNLHAMPDQIVVLTLDDQLPESGASGSVSKTSHTVSYYLPEQSIYKFALETISPCIAAIRLYDESGNQVLNLDQNSPNALKTFESGKYRLIIDEITPLPTNCSVAFIRLTDKAIRTGTRDAATLQPVNPQNGQWAALGFTGFNDSSKHGARNVTFDTPYNLSIYANPVSNHYALTYGKDESFEFGKKLYHLIRQQQPVVIGDTNSLFGFQNRDGNMHYSMYSKALGFSFPYQFATITTKIYLPFCNRQNNCPNIDPQPFNISPLVRPYKNWVTDTDPSNWFYAKTINMFAFWDAYSVNNYNSTHEYVAPAGPNPANYAAILSFDPNSYQYSLQFQSGQFNFYSRLAKPWQPYDNPVVWFYGSGYLDFRNYDGSPGNILVLAETYDYLNTIPNYSHTLNLFEQYRYFDNSNTLTSLGNEEVALYNQTLATRATSPGQAVMINSSHSLPNVDFSRFPVRSIKVGYYATLVLYDQPNFTGNKVMVGSDVADLSTDPRLKSFGPIRSLQVLNTRTWVYSGDCPGCNLQGLNLSVARLQGRNFSYANLSNCQLNSSNLMYANLTGANLSSTDLIAANLSSATMSQVDLTSANIQATNFQYTDLSRSVLRGVNLAVAFPVFTNSNFSNSDLAGAKMQNLDFSGADFSSATLDNALLDGSVFAGAKLNGAQMNSVSLVRARLNQANLSNAVMKGANLNYANLQGANLYHALLSPLDKAPFTTTSLQGAYLQDANLALVDATAADFSNASFFSTGSSNICMPNQNSCAGAQFATFKNTIFSQSYLAGLDLSNANLTGATLTNALLLGANLGKTILTSARLNGSYLFGADLGTAITDGATFNNALVDNPPSGAHYLIAVPYLGSAYTAFSGAPDIITGLQYVCPEFDSAV